MSWKQSPVAPGATLVDQLMCVALEKVPESLRDRVGHAIHAAVLRITREYWASRISARFTVHFVQAIALAEARYHLVTTLAA